MPKKAASRIVVESGNIMQSDAIRGASYVASKKLGAFSSAFSSSVTYKVAVTPSKKSARGKGKAPQK